MINELELRVSLRALFMALQDKNGQIPNCEAVIDHIVTVVTSLDNPDDDCYGESEF